MVATTVIQAMVSNPITVDTETSLEDIASLMLKHNVHTLPVLEQGKLVGIIGKEDILRTLMSNENKIEPKAFPATAKYFNHVR